MRKKKKEEKEDFLAVIKLVSGEEIISTVTPCEEDDRTLLLLDSPVMFENVMIRNGGIRVNNMKITDESKTISQSDIVGNNMVLLAAGKKNKLLLMLQ